MSTDQKGVSARLSLWSISQPTPPELRACALMRKHVCRFGLLANPRVRSIAHRILGTVYLGVQVGQRQPTFACVDIDSLNSFSCFERRTSGIWGWLRSSWHRQPMFARVDIDVLKSLSCIERRTSGIPYVFDWYKKNVDFLIG